MMLKGFLLLLSTNSNRLQKATRIEAKLLPFSSASIFKAHFATINGMLLGWCS